MTIIDFVEQYTHQYSDLTFLREKVNGVWTETSFRQTREEAYRIAAGLIQLGLKKGEKVALLSQGRNLWITSELGILYAGGVNVPLSIKLTENTDLLFRLQHSDARFVIVSRQQLDKIRGIIHQCPLVEKVIILDPIDEYLANEMPIDQLIQMGEDYLQYHMEEFRAIYQSIQPDDYANISYTSGTTADPKGILLTHRNYTANVEQGASVIQCRMHDIMLIILPLDHCFAHVAGFYTMMYYGGSIATVPVGRNAIATLKNIPIAIREIRPHLMLSVPTLARNFRKNIEASIHAKGAVIEKLYNFALNNAIQYYKEYHNKGGNQAWRLPLVRLFDKIIFRAVREAFGGRMRFFVGGGALLDIELQRYFCAVGMPMFQGYGLSEATPIICANSEHHAIFGSSGRIVSPLDLKICDEDGNEVPHGHKGEIVIRGENVMAGYWKNPTSTAKTVVDGWLHTGDLGYVSEQHPGYLWVVGRFKSLLITADGEKYSPEGFEDSLADGSKYIEQVVLHNNQDPYTIAIIVPNKDTLRSFVKTQGLQPDSTEAKQAMLKKIQDEVNEYKNGKFANLFPEMCLPKAIIVVPEPFTEQNHMLNSTMKVVRNKVEKYYEERIQYAYTTEGKSLFNPQNIRSI